MTDTAFPVLYLLPRTDMESMNPGKAMAHTAHAANAFVHKMQERIATGELGTDRVLRMLFETWQASTPQGFGTTIVLRATHSQSLKAVGACWPDSWSGIDAGWCTDPTYPYILSAEAAALVPDSVDTLPRVPQADGTVLMFRREKTCAWVFGDKNEARLRLLLDNLQLHP